MSSTEVMLTHLLEMHETSSNQFINVLNFVHSLLPNYLGTGLNYKARHSHSLEQSITQPDGNSLGLCVVGKRSLAELSSDT